MPDARAVKPDPFEDCVYWDEFETTGMSSRRRQEQGHCRRHVPMVVPHPHSGTAWPVTGPQVSGTGLISSRRAATRRTPQYHPPVEPFRLYDGRKDCLRRQAFENAGALRPVINLKTARCAGAITRRYSTGLHS
jgi:hypothetical protein